MIIKAQNLKLDFEFLERRYSLTKDKYPKQKWIIFCERMLEKGFDVFLYEASQTKSKYITVKSKHKNFKVRFSDHKPIKQREACKDCDFFVGRTNFTVTTTEQAIGATLRYMNGESEIEHTCSLEEDGISIFTCINCGAYSDTPQTIKHYPTCSKGG